MKVLGQLEGAQFENLTAQPSPVSAGQFYFDTATGKPWIYSNVTSTWKELLTGPVASTDFYDAGNSGKAITINWTNGARQKLTLSDNSVISFSNPVAGTTYTLAVKQANFDNVVGSSAPFKYTLNMTDQSNKRFGPQPNVRLAYQPQSVLSSTETGYHQWFYSSNVQPAYATAGYQTNAPSTTTATANINLCVSPSGRMLALGASASPYGVFYPIFDRGQKFEFGFKPTPTTGVGAITNCIRYSPDGNLIAYAHTSTPFVTMYGVLADINTAGTYANPSTLPAGTAGYCVDWHPTGLYLAVGSQASPFIQVYGVTASGFGNILSNPASLPVAASRSCAFSPQGDFLAVVSTTSPYLEVYNFSYGTGVIGGKLSNPSTLPTGAPSSVFGARLVSWRPQGDWIALATATTPYLYLVPFNRSTGAFGTPQTIATADIPDAALLSVAFSPDGNYLAITLSTAPRVRFYSFSASGYVGPYTAGDDGGPASAVNDIAWHPSGDFVFFSVNSTPYLSGCPAPRAQRNYLRISL